MDQEIEEMLARIPDNTDPALCINALALHFMNGRDVTGASRNVHYAINLFGRAVKTAAPNHPKRAMFLNNLSGSQLERFKITKIRADLENAVGAAKEAVDITLLEHPNSSDAALYQNTLGSCLGQRYEVTGELQDLSHAVKALEASVKATSSNEPIRAIRLYNCSESLNLRYEKSDEIEDLQQSIELAEEALGLIAVDHQIYVRLVQVLFQRFVRLHETKGLLQDLERALRVLIDAVKAVPPLHPSREMFEKLLVSGFCFFGKKARDVSDLDHTIEMAEEFAKNIASEVDDRNELLASLGLLHTMQWELTGRLLNIDRAVDLGEEQLNALPPYHHNRSECLTALGKRFGMRYQSTGDIEDINRAIKLSDEAVETTPSHHRTRYRSLDGLGNSLLMRFERTGDMQELHRAVKILDEAMRCAPDDGSERAVQLSIFGNCLFRRYERMSMLQDLTSAISAQEEAIRITNEDDPVRPRLLNGLMTALGRRFERTTQIEDLDRAIRIGNEAVKASSSNTADRSMYLQNVGLWLRRRYATGGKLQDLDEAIDALDEATDVLEKATGNPDSQSFRRAVYTNNLGNSLHQRYEATQKMADLDRAIDCLSLAARIFPFDHAHRAMCLSNLGTSLFKRWSRTGSTQDVKDTIQVLQESWELKNTLPHHRVFVGQLLATYFAGESDWRKAHDILEEAVGLLPLITPRSLQVEDQQHLLKRVSVTATLAAAAALGNDCTALHALQLLELGRGVISGLLLDMRTDVSSLKQEHPDLAQQFTSLCEEINSSEITDSSSGLEAVKMVLDIREERRRKADEELGQLLEDIRAQNGFHDFLRPLSGEAFMNIAAKGPIVVINVSFYRCDAILVERHQIRSLKLPLLKLADVNTAARQLIDSSVVELGMLEWLWDTTAQPILDTLGLKESPKNDEWPRVWWIPTGPLCHLPIHAAGHHKDGSVNTVLDRVMSSYSTSIKALLHGRHRKAHTISQSKLGSAVLVAMTETPDLGPNTYLGSAAKEVDTLSSLCPQLNLEPVQPARCKKDVLDGLRSCFIFHFAGHGKLNSVDPSRSSLLLEDWKDNPLTVADLRDQNFQEFAPFLGYLSACSTGTSKMTALADEGIHLINAFQLSGFRHAIGSLWDVSDMHCVDVAKILYRTMIGTGISDDAVCFGLHSAVRALRSPDCERTSTNASTDCQDMQERTSVSNIIAGGENSVDYTSRSAGQSEDSPVHDNTGRSNREYRAAPNADDEEPEKVKYNGLREERNAYLVEDQDEQPTNMADPRIWAPFIHYGV
ncbi:MAG: hypothetical protein M1822_006327 [Bathelium mastoideum]|nr:MAG: hypothetical protein M1822_006327 [Bathelium mastoideum]